MATATTLPPLVKSQEIAAPWSDMQPSDVQQRMCYIEGCGHVAHHTCEYCGWQICQEHHRVYSGVCEVERDYCSKCYTARTQRDTTMRDTVSDAYERFHLGMIPETAPRLPQRTFL